MFRSLKGKILSIYVFLIFLISLIAIITIYNLYNLNRAIDGLVESNYRSIAAATNMIDAIERQDSNQLIYLEVEQQKGIRAFDENEKEFIMWLDKAQDNVTEPNEKEILEGINSNYLKYIEDFSVLQEISNTEGSGRAIHFYDSEISPVFNSIKEGCRNLLTLNEQAMLKSKERATVSSRNQMYGTALLSAVSILLGLIVSIYFTRKAINPIYMLISGVKSIREGSLNQEIRITTQDEIGELATEFNNMSRRLLQYDKSSVRNLITEKNKSLAIVKSISDPIVVLDSSYRITLVNKSAENVFSISEKEVLKGHFLEAISDRNIYRIVKDTIERGLEVQMDNDPIVITRDNKTYYYMLTVTSVPDDINGVSSIICVFNDITHLKEMEQMKSDFISTVSHELRTPLTSIIMGSGLLLEDDSSALSPDQKEIVQAIDEDGNQLMLLINDLLDLSRVESGKMLINLEKVSIYSIVELSIRPLMETAESRGIHLSHDVSPELPPVYADRNKIKIVISNLVTNALKFTARDGHVTISAKPEGALMKVWVKDTGVGIPEEYQEKIFDRFTQVRTPGAGGTGLGLAITREFLKKNNGDIWVESKPGKGSTFIFTLPLYKG
jgi:PAS domain S-box-containing protein